MHEIDGREEEKNKKNLKNFIIIIHHSAESAAEKYSKRVKITNFVEFLWTSISKGKNVFSAL